MISGEGSAMSWIDEWFIKPRTESAAPVCELHGAHNHTRFVALLWRNSSKVLL